MEGRAENNDVTRELVEELVSAGLLFVDTLGSLLEDLPDDAFPGEDNATVLLEMVVGTCRPVVEAVGEPGCLEAIALVGAIKDRVIDDLKLAAILANSN